MSTQHTPAPWQVVEHSWSRTGIYAKHVGIAALDIADEATEETQGEWEAVMGANARLIAAAPDLLAALESTAHLLMAAAFVIEHDESRAHAIKTAEAAKAVISKATGR